MERHLVRTSVQYTPLAGFVKHQVRDWVMNWASTDLVPQAGQASRLRYW
jgi:hypothetical protein